MKKDYLKPDTYNVVFTAGCLEPNPWTDPNQGSVHFQQGVSARRGGAGPAINY